MLNMHRLPRTLLMLAAVAACAPRAWAQAPTAAPDTDQPGGAPDLTLATFDSSMLAGIALSSIPALPTKAVGAGTCRGSRCGAGSCETCWETCGSCPAPGVDRYGCPGLKQWALTFDDGPSDATPTLLDTLKQLGVKATFCVLGGRAAAYATTLKRIYDEGHLICSHSWSHPHLQSLSTEQIIAEVVQASRAIEAVIGVRPKYFRPPYGEIDARVRAVLQLTNHIPLLWNMDTSDYNIIRRGQSLSRIAAAFDTTLQNPTGANSSGDPGFISLQHDTFLQSVQQEPTIIPKIRGAGYSLMTVAECLGDSAPYKSAAGANVAGNRGVSGASAAELGTISGAAVLGG